LLGSFAVISFTGFSAGISHGSQLEPLRSPGSELHRAVTQQ